MSKKVIILLSCIILFGAFVRLYDLSTIPPGPFLDEVSNGYNAYSLMLTGNDEYGRHLPILLQAYNDFRPSTFVYTLIPFVKVFGLSVFSIRLPSVLLSLFATLCMFFLTSELLKYALPLSKVDKKQNITISLIATFLYACSPWSIYSARDSVEINMSLSYFIFAITAFLCSLNLTKNTVKSTFAFYCSVILFIIAFYSYHGIKVFLPVFILGLIIIFYKKLLARKKQVIFSICIAIILLSPLVLAFSKPDATVRFWAVNDYSQQSEIISVSADRILYDKIHHDLLGELTDNRRVLLSLDLIKNYLKNFDLEWLFLQQDGSKSYIVPDVGPFYLFEMPLLFIGIYFLIKNELFSKKIKIFLLIWILTSAIPSGISTESPQLNRMNTLLPALIIIIAFGLYELLNYINKIKYKNFKTSFFSFTIVIIAFSIIGFIHAYFIEFPHLESESYQYGIVQAFTYANVNQNKYQDIVVSNKNEFLESYMYYLFTTKYNPKIYQKEGGTHSAFFTDTHVIGKYDFRNPDLYSPQIMQKTNKGESILYLVNPGEISPVIIYQQHLKLIQKYRYLDGTDSVWIYSGKI